MIEVLLEPRPNEFILEEKKKKNMSDGKSELLMDSQTEAEVLRRWLHERKLRKCRRIHADALARSLFNKCKRRTTDKKKNYLTFWHRSNFASRARFLSAKNDDETWKLAFASFDPRLVFFGSMWLIDRLTCGTHTHTPMAEHSNTINNNVQIN